MNEYLKQITEDSKKYMPHGKNGNMWTSGTWSENYVLEKDEILFWDSWFNGTLITESNTVLNTNLFETKITIFERELPTADSIGSLLLSLSGSPFNLDHIFLCEKIKLSLNHFHKSTLGMWFYGHQGNAYHYNISSFGPFKFEDLITSVPFVQYKANLNPVLDNLINERRGQDYEYNFKLYSGVISEKRDWLLLLMLNKSKSLELSMFGDSTFCQYLHNTLF